ncbi:MAG: hypothetical protein ABS948_16105 [Solibacillus sp.]
MTGNINYDDLKGVDFSKLNFNQIDLEKINDSKLTAKQRKDIEKLINHEKAINHARKVLIEGGELKEISPNNFIVVEK